MCELKRRWSVSTETIDESLDWIERMRRHNPLDHQPTCNSNLIPGKACNCVGRPGDRERNAAQPEPFAGGNK